MPMAACTGLPKALTHQVPSFRARQHASCLVPRLPGCRPNSLIRVSAPEAPPASVQPQVAALLDASAAAEDAASAELQAAMARRRQQRKREQLTYQGAAIATTVGITFLAVMATYLRFDLHMRDGSEFPWMEMAGTLALVGGGMFGMEMYARFAHKTLWHDFEPGWALHKSHHEPRTGPFEDNDIFAVMNGVPAFALCMYGFLTPGVVGGMCFGAGLGITLFGIAYMFVHDGLVHRRFPVGPLAEHPFIKRLVAAHQLHHADKYGGAPWGMFLALDELDKIPGARDEVERMVRDLDYKRVEGVTTSK